MSIKISTRTWEHSKQSAGDLLLLLAISDHCDDDGVCWPGIERLAFKTRISYRQAERNIKKLESRGELFIFYQSGRGNTNLYFVTVGLNQDEITNILMNRFGYTPDDAQILAEKQMVSRAKFAKKPNTKPDTDDGFCVRENLTSRAIKPDIQGQNLTSRVIKPDIAMSPEPSYKRQFKTSVSHTPEKSLKKILEQHRALALKLVEICGYKGPEFVKGKKLDELTEAVESLAGWNVTTEQLDSFGRWWWGENPPVFRQVVEEWGKFLNAGPDKKSMGRAPTLTPAQIAAARQMSEEMKQAIAETKRSIDAALNGAHAPAGRPGDKNGIDVQQELVKRLRKPI